MTMRRLIQASGVSNASGHNMIEFDVPDDVTGVITLQFDNLNGSKLADAVILSGCGQNWC